MYIHFVPTEQLPLPGSTDWPIQPPPQQLMALYPFQQVGAAFLAERRAANSADDMGLGKSREALFVPGPCTASTVNGPFNLAREIRE